MRICVLADTHMYVSLALKAIKEMGTVDLFIHLGDCYADAEKIHENTGLPFKAVQGNKIWVEGVPETDFFEIEGVKFMATHGHLFDLNVYDSPEYRQENLKEMAAIAKRNGVKVVLYGHDHKADKFYLDDILFFNPGEMTAGSYRCTYGILEISEGEFTLEHVEIEKD